MSEEIKSLMQETLNAQSNQLLNQIYTAIPCIVVSVVQNLETCMVNIQPTINQRLKDGTVSERTVILGVPVAFQASSCAAFTFPINPGDTGTAIFSMRSLDAWKSSSGKPSTPLNYAKFDKGDAIFYPGLQPPGVSINNPAKRTWAHDTKDAVVVNNIGTPSEVEVRLKASGDVQVNTSRNVIVNCDTAQIVASTSASINTPTLDIDAATTNWYGTFNLYGPLNHSGNYSSTGGTSTFNGVVFSSHVHGDSPGPSNP